MFEILVFVLIAFVLGCLIGFLIWSFSKNKRRASRIIDIISYAITAAAFSTSLLALKRYDDKFKANQERIEIKRIDSDIGFLAVTKLIALCSEPPSLSLRAADCKKMSGIFPKSHLGNPYLGDYQWPAMTESHVGTPDVRDYQDPAMIELAETLAQRTRPLEERRMRLIMAEASPALDEQTEYSLLRKLILVVVFAFGIGVMRRALDLYTDWGPTADKGR